MKTKWSKLQEMEKKLYLEVITGVKDLDEFDRFVEEWMEAGGEQITLEVTEAVREAKGDVYKRQNGQSAFFSLHPARPLRRFWHKAHVLPLIRRALSSHDLLRKSLPVLPDQLSCRLHNSGAAAIIDRQKNLLCFRKIL